MDFTQLLQEIGVDRDRTLGRFGGMENLLKKFLLKFPEDGNMALLTQAMESGDLELQERAAHTLKGVSANLGMEPLNRLCDQCVQQLRAGDAQGARESYHKMKEEHARVLQTLAQYQD